MSNLQVLARRCPVMGKAMAVQSARSALTGPGGVFGGARAYKSKANLHTTRAHQATVAPGVLEHHREGKHTLVHKPSDCMLTP